MLGEVPIKANTHIVVMELVSQQLVEYKNDNAISKLTATLLG